MRRKGLIPSLFKGVSYGLTSGVITTIGLVIGVYFSTRSYIAVIAGIISIAIADSLPDALGIHTSEESEKKSEVGKIWTATFFTFLTKLIITGSFLIPFVLFSIDGAFIASLIWGAFLLTALSYYLAKQENINPLGVISEHLTIAALVILATYFAGIMINRLFG